jgi:hypothetical protein
LGNLGIGGGVWTNTGRDGELVGMGDDGGTSGGSEDGNTGLRGGDRGEEGRVKETRLDDDDDDDSRIDVNDRKDADDMAPRELLSRCDAERLCELLE